MISKVIRSCFLLSREQVVAHDLAAAFAADEARTKLEKFAVPAGAREQCTRMTGDLLKAADVELAVNLLPADVLSSESL